MLLTTEVARQCCCTPSDPSINASSPSVHSVDVSITLSPRGDVCGGAGGGGNRPDEAGCALCAALGRSWDDIRRALVFGFCPASAQRTRNRASLGAKFVPGGNL